MAWRLYHPKLKICCRAMHVESVGQAAADAYGFAGVDFLYGKNADLMVRNVSLE